MATFTDGFGQTQGTDLASLGYIIGQFVTGSPSPIAIVDAGRAKITGYAPFALRTVAAGDLDFTVTVPVLGSFPAVFLRYVDTNNYVYWRADGLVRDRAAGVSTETMRSGSWVAGDVIRFILTGNTVRPSVSGVESGSFTVSAATAGSTLAGIGSASGGEAGAYFDDLSITDSAVVEPEPAPVEGGYLLPGGTLQIIKSMKPIDVLDTVHLVRGPATVLTKFHLAHLLSGGASQPRGQLWPRGSDYFTNNPA